MALIIAIASTIYAIIWRALAQRYMEFELLTPIGTVKDYFGNEKYGHHVTDPDRFKAIETRIMRTALKLAPYLVTSGLLLSWTLIGIHLVTLLG